MKRTITISQAERAYAILVEECGAPSDYDRLYEFVQHTVKGTTEYRFIGDLGFGGKFWNANRIVDGKNSTVPYVNYYSEHMNVRREIQIDRANQRLAELFAEIVDADR